MEDTVEFNTKPLDRLLKVLQGDTPVVKVGIIGSSKASKRTTAQNASIGAKHEFGMEGMPVRSFLRVPIAEHMQEYLDEAKAFSQASVNRIIKEGTLVPWMKKLGVLAETIVSDAFSTGGFGQWKESDMRFKKNHQTLVETKQLRESITSEVK